MTRIIEVLRKTDPAIGLQVVLAHALLLVGALFGGLPYVVVQGLLGAELLLINIATIPFYPQRGAWRHATDTLKSAGLLLFVLFFLFVGYGVVAAEAGRPGAPLEHTIAGLRGIGAADLGWALAYLLARVGFTSMQARRSRDPRGTWTRQSLAFGGSTLVAMLLMVFVTFFVGVPVVTVCGWIGWHVDADVLLGALMIGVRCCIALVASTMPASEMDEIARNPYVDAAPDDARRSS